MAFERIYRRFFSSSHKYTRYVDDNTISYSTDAAAGGSDDWMMGVAGADLSYTMELPGGRFDPPPSRIASVGMETFEAFKIFQQFVEEKYVRKSLLN